MTPVRAWVTLLLVSVLFFIITAATFTSLGLVLPAMVAEMGWSWSQAGAGFSLLGVFCGITSTIPAMLIRRFGVRANFLIGTAIMAAAFACLAQTQGLFVYLLGTALAGFGFSLLATVPGTYLLTRLFPKPNFVFGLYFTIGGLGGVAGPFLYLWLADGGQDWRQFWMACGLLTLVCGVAAALFCDTTTEIGAGAEADPEISREPWTARAAMRTPQFLVLAVAYSAFLIVGITANATGVAHLTGARGVSIETAGTMMSIEAAVNAAARFLGGVLSALVGARILLVASLLALILGMTALSFGSGLPALLIYAVGIGLGYGLSFFASTILLLEYFGRKPNLELFALVNLVSTVGAAAPWAAGLTRDQSGSFVPFYLLLAVLMALIAAIAFFLKPPRARTA